MLHDPKTWKAPEATPREDAETDARGPQAVWPAALGLCGELFHCVLDTITSEPPSARRLALALAHLSFAMGATHQGRRS